MRIIPILYSTPMVQAILSGNKSMTRRTKGLDLFNEDPTNWTCNGGSFSDGHFVFSSEQHHTDYLKKCPYGQPGDILLMKEGYYQLGHWTKNGKTKTGRQKWSFVPASDDIRYCDNAPETYKKSMDSIMPYENMWYKRSGRFMPYKYARIFLRRTDTRVERLQDISEEDCVKEGIDTYADCLAQADFAALWRKLNGADSWNANPWVWVISFKHITDGNEIADIKKQLNERRQK